MNHNGRQSNRLSDRIKRDMRLELDIQRVWKGNFRVYGVRKVCRQLLREGIGVARCTVERLMKKLGLQGVRRGRKCWTTVANDLLYRLNGNLRQPGQINCGWRVRRSLRTDLVLDALEQTLWARRKIER